MFNKMKKAIQKFLDTIAEQNKSTYGDNRINCCDLNKSNQTRHKEK